MNEYDYEGYTIEHKYEVGQKVMWRGGFGSDAPKLAKITGLGDKNGRPLYDLDNGHWAYEYQLRSL
jgi:hypothetical protein